MEPVASHYRPSLFNPAKYFTYIDYFKEYFVCKDFKSLSASLKYVITHQLPKKDYETRSRMGSFHIRKGTTDFQFINHAYERKIKRYMQDHLDSFDVFIDAGACIGEYSIWLGKMGKRCVAIEPVNFEAVRRNIALNRLEDTVQLFTCGLGNKREQVYFNIPTGIPSSSYMDKASRNEPNAMIERFDDIFPKMNISSTDRILMKMDVEGMEVELIEGAADFIRNHKQLTFIYEHFPEDNYRNDKALLALAPFNFSDIDPVNRLAVRAE